MRLARLRAWLAPLLLLAGATGACAQTAGAFPGFAELHLLELSVAPAATQQLSTAWADELFQALRRRWRESLREPVALRDSRGGPEAVPGVRLRLTPGGGKTAVALTLLTSGGQSLASAVEVLSEAPEALAAAVSGEILYLLAGTAGFPPPRAEAPRLAGLLELSLLAQLDGGPGADSEALDCVAAPEGPVLLFSDRILSLGPRFELTPRGMGELLLRGPLPQGFLPAHLGLDPWGEPIVLSGSGGEVLRFSPAGAQAERFPLPGGPATDFAALPGGGFAALTGGQLRLSYRRDGTQVTAAVPAPGALAAALAADRQGRLWVYDLAERRLRITAAGGAETGKELSSVKPLVSPEALPFPQVLELLPDGSFLLGGAGELWRFDSAGFPLWRLRSFAAGVRQALPAFYRLAPQDERSFYLLDPLGGRLLRFVELGESGTPATGAEASPEAVPAADLELAGLFRRLEEGPQARAALVQACRDRALPLMALSVLGDSASGGDAASLERAVQVEQAGRLEELGRRSQEELLLPQAQTAFNAALRLLRQLRALDPVHPGYPGASRELEERRNGVRDILVAEPLLELSAPAGRPAGADAAASGSAAASGIPPQKLRLSLANISGRSLRELRFQARLAGVSSSTLRGRLAALGPSASAELLLPLPETAPGLPGPEDLPTRVLLLATLSLGAEERTVWLQAPVLIPAQRR